MVDRRTLAAFPGLLRFPKPVDNHPDHQPVTHRDYYQQTVSFPSTTSMLLQLLLP
jgi:hypothetical protein